MIHYKKLKKLFINELINKIYKMSYSTNYINSCNNNNIMVDHGFVFWINRIENYVFATINQHLLDLPDEDYMANYENGTSSQDIANIVINNYRQTADDLLGQ